MVKASIYRIGLVLLVLFLVLIGALIGGLNWILNSPTGTRWAIDQLTEGGVSGLSIGQLEGTLGGDLHFTDVTLNQSGIQLHLATLSMQNHWRGLSPIALEIGALRIEGVRLKTTESSGKVAAQGFSWPQLPWLLNQVQIALPDFSVRQVSWQRDNEQPLLVELLKGDLSWENGTLEAPGFQLQLPELLANGSFRGQLTPPQFQFSGQLENRATAATWQQVRLEADLQPGTAGQLLSGPVKFEISGAADKGLLASAEVGLTDDQVVFHHLQLRRPERPGTITANGSLRFSGSAAELVSQLQLDQLDLQAETGQPVRLSGSLQLKGGLKAYTGRFDLRNQGTGISSAHLSGAFTGDQQQLSLTDLQGEWLAGNLGGELRLGWGNGWQLQATLSGQGFDPQLLSPHLAGKLNLDLSGNIDVTPIGKRHGRLQLHLRQSQLHGHPLGGEAQLQINNDSLLVEQLQLRGEGILLQADGNPAERLTVHWQIESLEELFSGTGGQLSGDGWLRWQQQTLAAGFDSEGQQLSFGHWRLDHLKLSGEAENILTSFQLQLLAERLNTGPADLVLDRGEARLTGNLDQHHLQIKLSRPQQDLRVALQGGWDNQQWQGKLSELRLESELAGNWRLQQPASLQIATNLVNIDPLLLRDNRGGEIRLQGRYQPAVQQTDAEIHWRTFDLALLRPWLRDWRISGRSSGSLQLQQGAENALHGKVNFSGMVEHETLQLKIAPSSLSVDWKLGLDSKLQLVLVDGGTLNGTLTSAPSVALAWPQQADLSLTGADFPLSLLSPWLPPDLNISGQLGWSCSGSWRSGEPLNLTGVAHAEAGRFFWQEDEGLISADISSIDLNWQWHQELRGSLSLLLAEQGNIEGSFDLPLAAQWPLHIEQGTNMTAQLQARLQELGLLSILFPGRIQESRGQLKLDLQLAGTVREPQLSGNFDLFDAAAFIPALGVQLADINLKGSLADEQLQVAQLQLKSGQGQLLGSGRLNFQKWRPGSYQFQLKGENFQLINLPDLQVNTNPDLQVDGTLEKIRVRGQLKFPDVSVTGKQKSTLASNSPDLQVIDRQTIPLQTRKLQHDIDVQLLLGDRVLLNTAGIDARLEGSLRLQSTDKQDLAANGEIHVAKGKYSSYGVSLDITRGNLYFAGGPLDRPALDILALRTAGEVKAGVQVTGTPQAPIVQLYSEPAMADTDILSYIVLGHPVGSDQSQSGLLLTAAGALLSQGESVGLQEKLRGRLGLDVLDVSAGNGDINSSVITTGKYLSPDLYVSLGYSLFSNTDEAKIRYSLTPDWEIESSIGVESGIDMFYRIEIE